MPARVVAKGPEYRLDLVSRRIQMRRETRARGDGREDALALEVALQIRGLGRGDLDIDKVGLGRLDVQSQRSQPLREMLGVRVILRQLRHVMLQRIQPRRGEHSGLPHTAAQGLAPAARPVD